MTLTLEVFGVAAPREPEMLLFIVGPLTWSRKKALRVTAGATAEVEWGIGDGVFGMLEYASEDGCASRVE